MTRVTISRRRRQHYRQIEDDWVGRFSTSSHASAAPRDAEMERS
jgi:hypothetical protein